MTVDLYARGTEPPNIPAEGTISRARTGEEVKDAKKEADEKKSSTFSWPNIVQFQLNVF
jgi:hypothetical protein